MSLVGIKRELTLDQFTICLVSSEILKLILDSDFRLIFTYLISC